MTHNPFFGVGVAIVTPFHENGSIDFNAFGKHINFLIDKGIDYIVVLGTTGESATLTKDEKNAVISYAIDTIDKRVPLVVGIGGNATQVIIDTIKNTDFDSIDAILSVSPYYNKPAQKGIFEHYRILASVSPVPIILYNVPGRTGSNISADTTLKLAREVKNIAAIKEASGDMAQIMQIIKNKPDDFHVISGDDALTLPIISLGGSGVISVTANVIPEEFSNMVHLALENKMEEARFIHYRLIDFIETLFQEGNPGGIKAALEIKGMITSNMRLPLVPVDDGTYSKISNLFKQI